MTTIDVSTTHIAPDCAPSPTFNPLGYPKRERFAELTDAEIRTEGHKLLAQAKSEAEQVAKLKGDEARIADEIYNHPLNVLNRQLEAATRERKESEARAENLRRRGSGTLVSHQDEQLPRCKSALIAFLDGLRSGRQTIVSGSRRMKQSVAIERCLEALQAIEALVQSDYGDSAAALLLPIMATVGLTIPPTEAPIMRRMAEADAATDLD